MAAKASNKDKEMAATLKARKEERRTSKCCVCSALIGNDTFGGYSVMSHYGKHARMYQEDK